MLLPKYCRSMVPAPKKALSATPARITASGATVIGHDQKNTPLLYRLEPMVKFRVSSVIVSDFFQAAGIDENVGRVPGQELFRIDEEMAGAADFIDDIAATGPGKRDEERLGAGNR